MILITEAVIYTGYVCMVNSYIRSIMDRRAMIEVVMNFVRTRMDQGTSASLLCLAEMREMGNYCVWLR